MSEVDGAALKLRTAMRLLIRRAYTAVADNGPARSAQRVLVRLGEKNEMTPSIEKGCPQTTEQTLDSLNWRCWIKRTPHPKHRLQAWLVSQLSQLNAKDRQTLTTAVLDRIAQS